MSRLISLHTWAARLFARLRYFGECALYGHISIGWEWHDRAPTGFHYLFYDGPHYVLWIGPLYVGFSPWGAP